MSVECSRPAGVLADPLRTAPARIQYLRSPPCRTIVSGSSVNQDEGNAKRRQALDITTRLDESWNPLPDACIHSAGVTDNPEVECQLAITGLPMS